MRPLRDLVEEADLNALLRAVDGLCARRAWDELIDLAEMCEDAVDRGKQLWPIAEHVDYRLALEAPGPVAAAVVHPAAGRFSLGPLTEVLASTHTWAEVADHLEDPQVAAYVAQERVLRGEVLDGDDRIDARVLELPNSLAAWEPDYRLATYRSDHVEVAEPWEPRATAQRVEPADADELSDPALSDALLDLVAPWVAESNGAARVAVVEGDAAAAASRLTFGELRIGPLSPAEALQRAAWAGASGGAHGRRRGGAFGRFLAFYLVAAAGDLGWPASPEAVEDAATRLRWHHWDEGAAETGWVLRLCVSDPEDGWAAALAATDLAEEDREPGDGGGQGT